MKRSYVMLAKQRSGTRAFGSMLSGHTHVEYRNEIFHQNAQNGPRGFFTATKALVASDPSLWLPHRRPEIFKTFIADELERHPAPIRLVYDVKYNQTHHFDAYMQERWLQMPRFLGMIQEMEIPVIHIKRTDLLATCLSTIRAEKSGIWHISRSESQGESYEVDPNRVVREIEAREREIEAFDGWLGKYPHKLDIHYETFYSQTGPRLSEVTRVSEFLGLKNPLVAETGIGKQSSGQYAREVSNWAALVDRLSESGLSKYTEKHDVQER